MRALLVLLLLPALAAPVASQDLPAWAEPGGGLGAESLPPWLAPPDAPSALGPGLPPPCPPTGCATPPTQVPVDGGLGLLALAGAGYAARRLRRRP